MNDRPILRRCIACKQLYDRSKLFRVIRDFRKGVVLEKGIGRSAYLCKRESCLSDALKKKRLQKALRCQIHSSVVESLQKRLNICT